MARLKPPVSDQDHIKGKMDAPVVLVEYGDFQCPHCGAAHPMIKEIEKKFNDRMAFVFRHFPLSEVHPDAQSAAVAAEAAANQRKFWQMHDLIFENQANLSPNALLRMAETLNLNLKIFQQDIRDPKLFEKVEANFESGIISGVNGTPSFYINGVKYEGPYEFQSLVHAIDHAIPGNKTVRS
jgi:protein-disulfide isomerase